VARSVDELQDYYVNLLGMDSASPSHMDFTTTYDGSDADKGSRSGRKDAEDWHATWRASQFRTATLDIISSNPGSISKHYFPIVADENSLSR
jgi:hypothetical protein